jgi:hypothetical protein
MYKVVKKLSEMLADHVIGLNNTKVFAERVSYVFPDFDFLESNIKKHKPYMFVLIARQNFIDDYILSDTVDIQTISSIAHQGTSPASYSISGDHIGNHKYQLKIETSGSLGAAEYRLSLNDGQTWGSLETVPSDGNITIGDATIFTFGAEGDLVQGDIYSWETVSMQDKIFQTDKFTFALRIEIYAAYEDEFFGTDSRLGYPDQVLNFFKANRAIHDNEYIYRINLDKSAQPLSDIRAGLFRSGVSVILEGSLYHTIRVPLIGSIGEEIAQT